MRRQWRRPPLRLRQQHLQQQPPQRQLWPRNHSPRPLWWRRRPSLHLRRPPPPRLKLQLQLQLLLRPPQQQLQRCSRWCRRRRRRRQEQPQHQPHQPHQLQRQRPRISARRPSAGRRRCHLPLRCRHRQPPAPCGPPRSFRLQVRCGPERRPAPCPHSGLCRSLRHQQAPAARHPSTTWMTLTCRHRHRPLHHPHRHRRRRHHGSRRRPGWATAATAATTTVRW